MKSQSQSHRKAQSVRSLTQCHSETETVSGNVGEKTFCGGSVVLLSDSCFIDCKAVERVRAVFLL